MQLEFDNTTYKGLKQLAYKNDVAIKTMITRLIEQAIEQDQSTKESADTKDKNNEYNVNN